MKVVLVDNGSVEAAAHEALRSAAAAIGSLAKVRVEAVSWKHSNRIEPSSLSGGRAWTLAPWVRAQVAAGEKEFLFIPFFISPQGAIGSSLRSDLELLRADTGPFDFSFTEGLSSLLALPSIVADRVRAVVSEHSLARPPVIVVDHGGPSRISAGIRDGVADAVRTELGEGVLSVRAASMESPEGPEFDFNRPLLSDILSDPSVQGDVVVSPLFLSPGRHAGPKGDLAQIAEEAERAKPGLRCLFTGLVGSHPLATETLAGALLRALHTEAKL
jgi:hypothetical protein